MEQSGFKISFEMTGDPFVDAGGMALRYLQNAYPDREWIEMIRFVADIYVNQWGANLFSIFHGSRITHKAYVGQEKVTGTVKMYQAILKKESPAMVEHCRMCGQEDALYPVGRDQYCLAGSKPFANFHHLHEDGLFLCPSCSIKLFFLPLTLVQMGGMLALLHPGSDECKAYWTKKTVKENLDRVGRNTAEGILKHTFSNPRNALFDIAKDIIFENEKHHNEHLLLYHFTNFAASPDADIYQLPSPVFTFLSKITTGDLKQQWYHFVRRYYHIAKSSWDAINANWTDKQNNLLTEDNFRNNQNDVFEFLIAGKSIIPLLRRYAKSCFLIRLPFESLITSYYAMEVRRMEEKQVLLIRQIADTILDIGQKTDSLKKYLVSIEGASKAHQLRGVFLKIIKDNFKTGQTEPVITLDDYVTYLFPDGQYWGEIRDLLLIYLYEKMHHINIADQLVEDEDIQDSEPTITEEM
jgi:CRISPR-associated protein Cst1